MLLKSLLRCSRTAQCTGTVFQGLPRPPPTFPAARRPTGAREFSISVRSLLPRRPFSWSWPQRGMRPPHPRFSSNFVPAPAPLVPVSVGRWLLLSSSLVFGIIVVGGVTRLTESGLSITEWKPITGILPPLSQAAWDEEFTKYQATPEFKVLNHNITLDDFKRIYYMEWGHRVLGRLIGITFVAPFAYFAFRGVLPKPLMRRLGFLGALIGVQGAIGWYMVKSGLDHALMDTPGSVPRVSQYRLAAHLGTAFLLYACMFYEGLAVILDARLAKAGQWSGIPYGQWMKSSQHPAFRQFKVVSTAVAGLVFLTAMSGAFVAGLDAGLIYNEFPWMGNGIVPPVAEMFDPAYAKAENKADLWWRNLLENPTTVQFDHRLLATTTYFCIVGLLAMSMRPKARHVIPPATRRQMISAFGMANVQVILGISTLLYLVPTPLAAAHQAGSVALLTTLVHLLVTMRHPGAGARYWHQVWKHGQKIAKP